VISEFMHNIYVAEIYRHGAIFLRLIALISLYSLLLWKKAI